MITFNKLKKIVKIWINKVTDDKERIRETTGGRSGENRVFRTIEAYSTDDDIVRHVYINAYKDTNKNVAFFTIGFDCEEGETKCDNYEVLTVYLDGGTYWMGDGCDPGNVRVSKHFSNDEIRKLKQLIDNADETISDYLEKHPKFDVDETHAIHITELVFKECDNIEIKFIANNRIFNSKNKLYIGFETIDEKDLEHNYVFKVTKKRISISYPWGLRDDQHRETSFHEYEYVATFHGAIRPTEEEILGATFRWVVSDEVIKTANKEARCS